ncbi:MAG: hypothetical protein NTW62_01760 [Candidatus Nomurabacteria bacterium]|nr:hypothetical protein [Candidatus Nomurabacteria bacterium]
MKKIVIFSAILAVTALFSCKPTQELAKTEPEVKTAPPARNVMPVTYNILTSKKAPWSAEDILGAQFFTYGGSITLTRVSEDNSKTFDADGNVVIKHVVHTKRSIIDNNTKVKIVGPIDFSRKSFSCQVDINGMNAYVTFMLNSKNGQYHFKRPGGNDIDGRRVDYKNEQYSANAADEVVYLAFYPKIDESSDIQEEHTTGVSATSPEGSTENVTAPQSDDLNQLYNLMKKDNTDKPAGNKEQPKKEDKKADKPVKSSGSRKPVPPR